MLTEHRTQGEFVAVDAAGHAQPRPRADEAADYLVVAERFGISVGPVTALLRRPIQRSWLA